MPLYKIPRLVRLYETKVAIAPTYEEAVNKAYQKLWEKGIYSPLDLHIEVEKYDDHGYVYCEALVTFLHPKQVVLLTDLEKKRITGEQSSLLFIDEDLHRLEGIIHSLASTGVYAIHTIKKSLEAFNYLTDNQPDLVLVCHNLGGKNGLQLLEMLRAVSVRPPTIAYGDVKPDVIDTYFGMNWVHCFIPKRRIQEKMHFSIEKTLNHEPRPKTLETFMVT